MPHDRDITGRAETGTPPVRAGVVRDSFGLKSQPLSTSTRALPSRAGDGETLMPASSMAAILDSASPLPPETTAPAWPMVRPFGAVRPAMKPAIGFSGALLAPPP